MDTEEAVAGTVDVVEVVDVETAALHLCFFVGGRLSATEAVASDAVDDNATGAEVDDLHNAAAEDSIDAGADEAVIGTALCT